MSRIVTIASGKGGTGKTWLALSLAQALALTPGRRVLVVDGDWGLSNTDMQLGMLATASLPLDGTVDDLKAAVRPVPDAGIDLLATAAGSGRHADLAPAMHAALAGKIRHLARAYDWTVVDLPAGAERAVRDWWRLGNHRLLLTTPDPASITDAYAFLKLCARDNDARGPRVIVNRAPSRAAGDATAAKLTRAARHFLKLEPKTAGVLLEDPRVGAAIGCQRPFVKRYPTAATTIALETLARKLAGRQKPTAAPSLRLSEPTT